MWQGGWARLGPRLWLILTVYLAGLSLVWLAGDADQALLNQVRQEGHETLDHTARFISDYSDLNLCGPLAAVLWVAGAARGRKRWRKLGLACLMAGLMSGALVQGGKRLSGRPRPDAATLFPERLYGPTRTSKLLSFPSGHTATSTATGVSLIAAAPVVAVPATLYAVSVGWARMQLGRHYPLDVAAGAVIGLTCGLCFASAVPGSPVRLRRRKACRR